MHKKVLGRGIGALIPGADTATAVSQDVVERIALERILANPAQPRSEMDDAKLAELAQSIRQQGVMQPIVVRRKGYEFELIAGERRFRASRLAGLTEVPALVRDIPDEQLLEFALVENIQREDLSPMDEARAYQRLIEITKLSQQAVADKVGKNRATVANSLRLLQLPPEVSEMVGRGELSPGHARALLSLNTSAEIIQAALRIVEQGLTVREAEDIGRGGRKPRHKGRKIKRRVIPELVQVEEILQRKFATRVRVQGTQAKGSILIEYYSLEELERILETLGVTIS